VLRVFRQQGRKGAEARGADANGCARVDQARANGDRLIGARDEAAGFDPDDVGQLLALAYPDRIAQQRAPNGPAICSQRSRSAPAGMGNPFAPSHYWLRARSMLERRGGCIYLAATLRAETLPTIMPGM